MLCNIEVRPLLVTSIVVASEEEFLITSKDLVNCMEIVGHLNHNDLAYRFYLYLPNYLYAIEMITHVGMLILDLFSIVGIQFTHIYLEKIMDTRM